VSVSDFEIDMNKLLLTALIALLSWNIYTTHKLVTDVAVIKSTLDTNMNRNFSVTDGLLLVEKVGNLERRIEALGG
jgi:hypothetical protein